MALFYTIGHSTRSLCELLDILEKYEIRALIDVRAIPRSRTNPQFNCDAMPAPLGRRGIDYQHFPELGGRRSRQREIGKSPNLYWQNQSFRNFADYAMTDGFRQGFARLKRLGEEKLCTIMCSEVLWWRCHRRIITDYLILAGEAVAHIYDSDKVEEAKPTPAARPTPDGKIVYDLAA
jgi:uncharacterized protein (DUF488 family)